MQTALGLGDRFDRGRRLINTALGRIENGNAEITRLASGAPNWPEHIKGSLSHSSVWCVCGVAHIDRVHAYGIDIEPVHNPDVLFKVASTYLSHAEINICKQSVFATPSEALTLGFSAKETVMKAFSCPHKFILPFSQFSLRAIKQQHVLLQIQHPRGAMTTIPSTVSVEWGRFEDHIVTRFLWLTDSPPPVWPVE